MSEHPLKVFEKIDPEVLTLVRNTNTFALADLVTISKICSSSHPYGNGENTGKIPQAQEGRFQGKIRFVSSKRLE